MDQFRSLLKIPLTFLKNVKKIEDLILQFGYNDVIYSIVLPTKIERNLWYYSIKNLISNKDMVDYEALPKVALQEWKSQYTFWRDEHSHLQLPI